MNLNAAAQAKLGQSVVKQKSEGQLAKDALHAKALARLARERAEDSAAQDVPVESEEATPQPAQSRVGLPSRVPTQSFEIGSKALSLRLPALDVVVTEDHVAVMLPPDTVLLGMEFKSKYTIKYGGQSMQVTYINGRFDFAVAGVLLLTFIRTGK